MASWSTPLEGQTILEAARASGKYIPTLCYLEGSELRLAHAGSAWSRSRASIACFPACTTPVQDGMSVTTTSPKLSRYRRITIELLLVERNHVCAVCVANGHCELQDMAYSLGITSVRFAYNFPKLPVDMSVIRVSCSTTTAASCARAACGCARKSKARTSGHGVARHPRPHCSRPEPEVGRRQVPAPIAANACRLAPPARWRKRARRWRKW